MAPAIELAGGSGSRNGTEIVLARSLMFATPLSTSVTATAWGQTLREDIRQHRMDAVWGQANGAFHASETKADEAYRNEFQAANVTHVQGLANSETAFEGLYWALKDAEHHHRSPVAAVISDALAERAQDRIAAHREWASSVSDMMSRWNDSMEKPELSRSAFAGEKTLLIERQLSDCR